MNCFQTFFESKFELMLSFLSKLYKIHFINQVYSVLCHIMNEMHSPLFITKLHHIKTTILHKILKFFCCYITLFYFLDG